MSREIPPDGLYHGTELLSPYHERRNWPISDPPACYDIRSQPTITPGQLVQWIRHPDTDLKPGWFTPHYVNKHFGIVLKTRWVLDDWVRYDNKEPALYPEALILWADGDTTNTSHGALCAVE